MYFYAITGKQKVKNITETTNDEGEIVLVTNITEVDVKKVITQKQANEYVKNLSTYTTTVPHRKNLLAVWKNLRKPSRRHSLSP